MPSWKSKGDHITGDNIYQYFKDFTVFWTQNKWQCAHHVRVISASSVHRLCIVPLLLKAWKVFKLHIDPHESSAYCTCIVPVLSLCSPRPVCVFANVLFCSWVVFKLGLCQGQVLCVFNVPSCTSREMPQMSLEGFNGGSGVGFPMSSHVSSLAHAWLFKRDMWTCALFP